MKNQITKSGLLSGMIIAAVLLAFSFSTQANIISNEVQGTVVDVLVAPDGEKVYDTKCSGETKEAKKTDKKTKTGAVSAEKKTTEEGKCGESKTTDDKKASTTKVSSDEKTKTTEGKCGEGKCGEGKCGVSKH
jgi:uncharacterized low-complexity protein